MCNVLEYLSDLRRRLRDGVDVTDDGEPVAVAICRTELAIARSAFPSQPALVARLERKLAALGGEDIP